VSCSDRLGADQLVIIGEGGGVLGSSNGSDPSNPTAFPSWSKDGDSSPNVRAGRDIGTSEMVGHCKEESS
jgi:hypothetical protein